jgi:hypothetical protein
MNFIFYLVVGFSKQFHLAYGFEANKMRSSSKTSLKIFSLQALVKF